MIRRSPNGTTQYPSPGIMAGRIQYSRSSHTQGSETSQYLQEKKSNEMAQVAASERAQA